jgi:hypothetical protein
MLRRLVAPVCGGNKARALGRTSCNPCGVVQINLSGEVQMAARKSSRSGAKTSTRKTTGRRSTRKSSSRKYSSKASSTVESAMRRRKHGTLKSSSGRKVTSREQAIAIGISEAREKGEKVPRNRASTRASKNAARKSSSRKSSSRNSASRKTAARTSSTRKSSTRKTSQAPGRKSARKSVRKSSHASSSQ